MRRMLPTILMVAVFAGYSNGQPMNTDGDDLRQLAHILSGAYGNALMHDTPNANLEAKDRLLESASMRFSSRVLYEITRGSCQPDEQAGSASADHACVLNDESVALRSLTDMLSYAASRLENLSRSISLADGTGSQRALVMARIGSMEHLYRMAFALSMIYLDRTQSRVYLEAGREQLRLAREYMEMERRLCACDDHGYSSGLLELSQIEDELKDMLDDAARR